MLIFGGFIRFTTAVVNEDIASLKQPLTERRFRSFWTQTKDFAGNDRKRRC